MPTLLSYLKSLCALLFLFFFQSFNGQAAVLAKCNDVAEALQTARSLPSTVEFFRVTGAKDQYGLSNYYVKKTVSGLENNLVVEKYEVVDSPEEISKIPFVSERDFAWHQGVISEAQAFSGKQLQRRALSESLRQAFKELTPKYSSMSNLFIVRGKDNGPIVGTLRGIKSDYRIDSEGNVDDSEYIPLLMERPETLGVELPKYVRGSRDLAGSKASNFDVGLYAIDKEAPASLREEAAAALWLGLYGNLFPEGTSIKQARNIHGFSWGDQLSRRFYVPAMVTDLVEYKLSDGHQVSGKPAKQNTIDKEDQKFYPFYINFQTWRHSFQDKGEKHEHVRNEASQMSGAQVPLEKSLKVIEEVVGGGLRKPMSEQDYQDAKAKLGTVFDTMQTLFTSHFGDLVTSRENSKKITLSVVAADVLKDLNRLRRLFELSIWELHGQLRPLHDSAGEVDYRYELAKWIAAKLYNSPGRYPTVYDPPVRDREVHWARGVFSMSPPSEVGRLLLPMGVVHAKKGADFEENFNLFSKYATELYKDEFFLELVSFSTIYPTQKEQDSLGVEFKDKVPQDENLKDGFEIALYNLKGVLTKDEAFALAKKVHMGLSSENPEGMAAIKDFIIKVRAMNEKAETSYDVFDAVNGIVSLAAIYRRDIPESLHYLRDPAAWPKTP